MKKLIGVLGFLVFFSVISIGQAQSQQSGNMPQCSERDSVVSYLEKKYKETPVAIGVTSNGGLVEVLSTENGGTWTIIVTSSKGWSCLVAAGEGWKSINLNTTDESGQDS